MVMATYRRLVWRHLPVMLAGVLAGYIVGCNKPAVRRTLSLQHIFASTGCTDTAAGEQTVAEQTVAEQTVAEHAAAAASHPAENRAINAALVALVRNSDLFGLRKTIRQIEDRFNARHNYPYIFVNDVEFTDEFKHGVRDLTRAQVHFGTLDNDSWKVPEWIDPEQYALVKKTAQYPHGEKDSYRKMCRFQSGYLHHHPLLRNLDYYWRIEPDVEYYCDMGYDPFVFMKEHGIKYGWNIAMTEFMATVPTLWNTTVQFVSEHPEFIAHDSLWQWMVDEQGRYNGCHFWSNFEIVDLSFYRSKEYQMFFEHLDKAGGFFYERWGDAPVHSIAASLFLNASQVHYFSDIGYFHPSVLTCPSNARTRGSCVCDSSKSFVQNGLCTARFLQVKQAVISPNATAPAVSEPVYFAQPTIRTVHSYE
ncbi:nucleotide-diphospho-sugar transferase [Coemansia mojavensis]|nr:nucleotide-diphospho-sugar transferase [Coemansia mojavensis]